MKIRNVNFGSGIPKICVPLTASSLDGLLAEAGKAKTSGADLAEWRADYFDGKKTEAVTELKHSLGNVPLIFTYRTVAEGGRGEAPAGEYLALNREVVVTGLIDLLDVELSSGDDICRELIALSHRNGTAAVLSSHDFSGTPLPADMLGRMRKALALGGDIPKLAVTPNSPADVLALLNVTEQFARENPGRPAITMSMGRLGVISRISGEFFGSAVTFASLDRATAPGQLPVGELREVLRILCNAG